MHHGGEILKTKTMKYAGLLIGLVFVLSLFPQSSAAVVWSEDFETGMDGWNVTAGNYRITDGCLESYQVSVIVYRIWHPSSQVVGTWSFDQYHLSMDTGTETILFMANGTDPPDNYYGYGLKFEGSSVYIVKQSGGSGTAISLKFVILEDFARTWTHYDITRNSTGGINVYINATSTLGEPDLSAVDTEYNYSERLVIYELYDGNMWDNIVVDNASVDVTQTTPTPHPDTSSTTTTTTSGGTPLPPTDTTLLLIGAGVGGVVILIAAVVFMKRR
jgi:hypothetical protein